MSSVSQLLESRVVLVTGGSRNIGAAIADSLATAGAIVLINYRSTTSAEAANAAAQRIRDRGGISEALQADVTDVAAVERMIAKIEKSYGPVEILVNNAAASVTSDVPLSRIDPGEWDAVLRTNLTGAFICARAVIPGMRQQRRGRIVSLSSIRVLLGSPGNIHYTTSKAGLIGFTRVLARELGPDEITANAVIVGAIVTPEEVNYGPDVEELVLEHQALKRRGIPEDVGHAVAFLASDQASFITGQSIVVDGGWSHQ